MVKKLIVIALFSAMVLMIGVACQNTPASQGLCRSNSANLIDNRISSDSPNWILRSPANKPSGRYKGAMVYDSVQQKMVLFGGSTGSDETWEWNGTDWTLRTSIHKPAGRYAHTLAYDSAREKVVLFGGEIFTYDGTTYFSDETWEWDGTDWTLRTPVHKPSPRMSHAMSYDSARQKVVLVGGQDATHYWTDTWEWDGTDWTEKTPFYKELGECGSNITYDSRNVVIMRELGWFTETWKWNGTNWALTSPANPTSRCSHGLTYDSKRGYLVLSTGDETWKFDGTKWILELPNTKPEARWGHVMAYDSARDKVVLFGGVAGVYPTNETWEWEY